MVDSISPALESAEEQAETTSGNVRRWIMELNLAEQERHDWCKRAKKIVRRYKDERKNSLADDFGINKVTKYNILWSNVNTMSPSLYSRDPIPQVERRFRDADPIGKAASMILERATDYSVKAYDFGEVMRACVSDLLLVGSGQAWVRYIPYFDKEVQKTPVTFDETQNLFLLPDGSPIDPEVVQQEENGTLFTEDAGPDVVYEEVKCDYIFWEDFLHSPAKVWDDVRWVARKVLMTRDQLRDRFDNANNIPLDHVEKSRGDDLDLGVENEAFKKATIYEIWDKESRRVYWVHKSMPDGFLDEEEDPLGLTNFFPCPKPLLSTHTTDSLIPIPDFSLYQDQARELDELSSRITLLVQALKVAGVYASDFDGIKRLLEEGAENKLIPIPDWPNFQQRGGFDGVMQFMPLQEIANVLQIMYQARAQIIQDIYQITGISDIIRGTTSPSETATAQQIKGQFATLRLAERQRDVQRFARDIIALKAEVIAEQFDTDTIRLMSGAEFIDSPDVPFTFENAVELLRNDALRAFRIDIETDSTLAVNESLEKEKRTEFVATIGRFLSNTLQVMQAFPELSPMMGQSLLFLMRGFKASRTLEASTEQSLAQLTERLMTPPEPPQGPSPEEMQMQFDQQLEQAKLQVEQFKVQSKTQLEQQKAFADAEIKQLRLQIEAKESSTKEAIELQKAQAEIELLRQKLESETALRAAEIDAKMALKQQEIVEKQNIETIKALTESTAEQNRPSTQILPYEIKIVTQPKEFRISTDPVTGERVAKQTE